MAAGAVARAGVFRFRCCRVALIMVSMTCSREGTLRTISLQDAEDDLSALVASAARGETTIIARHGQPEAVLIGMAEWERLSRVPSFARLLMAVPLGEGDFPARDTSRPGGADL